MLWRDLGAKIQRLREQVPLTQAELAQAAGLSRIYIQKLEAGERQSPSLDVLERIARALNATLTVDLKSRRKGGGGHGR